MANAQNITALPYSAMVKEADFGFFWWPNGYPASKGNRDIYFQTGKYTIGIDADTLKIKQFILEDSLNIDKAIGLQGNQSALDDVLFDMSIFVGEDEYKCVGIAELDKHKNRKYVPYKLINCGRYLQRYDFCDLDFRNKKGQALDIDSSLEIHCWPDQLVLKLNVNSRFDYEDVAINLTFDSKSYNIHRSQLGNRIDLSSGKNCEKSLIINFNSPKDYNVKDASAFAFANNLNIEFKDSGTGQAQKVFFDRGLNNYEINVPAESFKPGKFPESIKKYSLTVINPEDVEQTARLIFDTKIKLGVSANIIGTIPILMDKDGNHTGIPVQISKNWHETMMERQNWYKGIVMIHVPAKSKLEFDYLLIHGVWQGLPAVSHAQLALNGWGVNQQWDQVAIGNWGESICYDPEMCLGRSFVNDMRPLMVWSIGDKKKKKWGWTTNVGGGDLLVYFDENNVRQDIVGVKSKYDAYGPNLTNVAYTGKSADGKIDVKFTASTPAVDDYNKNFHTLRYDIVKPVKFNRLAFYQLGADRYNDNKISRMAYGNSKGLVKDWQPKLGGLSYSKRNVLIPGSLPWFSLYQASPEKIEAGSNACANRGLVVRKWKARLGGKDINSPSFSVYGTENHFLSANIEISPPSDIKTLIPGDFVEMELELLVVPQFSDDYYGTNQELVRFMKRNEDSWELIYREVLGNNLQVTCLNGAVVNNFPVVIDTKGLDKVEFSIKGGIGFVPVTLIGLDKNRNNHLYRVQDGNNVEDKRSVNNNWQYEYSPDLGFNATIMLDLDLGDINSVKRFVFKRDFD